MSFSSSHGAPKIRAEEPAAAAGAGQAHAEGRDRRGPAEHLRGAISGGGPRHGSAPRRDIKKVYNYLILQKAI